MKTEQTVQEILERMDAAGSAAHEHLIQAMEYYAEYVQLEAWFWVGPFITFFVLAFIGLILLCYAFTEKAKDRWQEADAFGWGCALFVVGLGFGSLTGFAMFSHFLTPEAIIIKDVVSAITHN